MDANLYKLLLENSKYVENIKDDKKHLTFGYNFNQPLEIGVIPDSVKYIEFGKGFNQPLNISHELTELIIFESYTYSLSHIKTKLLGKINDKYYIIYDNNIKMIYDHRCDFNNYINDIEETFEKEEFTSNISKKNLLKLSFCK